MLYFVNLILCISLIKMVTWESSSPDDEREGGIRLNSQISLVLCFRMCTAVLSFPLHICRVQPTRCNVSRFIYFCKMLCMFQTVFPSIIRSSKLHIQRQVFVRPIPDAVCAVLSSDDGRKAHLKRVERLTEINCVTLHLVGCTLRIY